MADLTTVPEWPLIGRTTHLRRFGEMLVASSNQPGLAATGMAFVGAAGVGKTRLASACLDVAGQQGWRTARVAGSRAAASIPFGAAASLLATGGTGGGGVDLAAMLQRSHQELTAGGRLCLMIDDAHLLDDASATLVQHLATSSSIAVVVTARSDERPSDVLRTLWGDGVIARVELTGLDRTEHDELLHGALGGPVEPATAERLFAATNGNPLFARELLLAANDDNALLGDGRGGWRMSRLPRSSSRLAELVASRVGALDDAERRCLELIAVAEPLGLDLIERIGLTAAVAKLERRQLVRASTAGARIELTVAHPLYAEVARDRLPPLRARNLRRLLADTLEATGARRNGDALRIATWRSDAGLTDQAANLVVAAREASLAGDPAASLRFGAAAHEASPSAATATALAAAHHRTGDGVATESVLASAVERLGATMTPADRWRIDDLRARNLFWLLADRHAAFELLVSSNDDAAPGALSQLRFADGGGAAPDDPAIVRALSAMFDGRHDLALHTIRTAGDAARLDGLEAFVLAEGGWFAASVALAERDLADGAAHAGSGWAMLALATVRLADGDGRATTELCNAARRAFAAEHDHLPAPLCCARAAASAMLVGDLDAALDCIAPIDDRTRHRAFGTDLVRARAMLSAVVGDADRGAEALRAHLTSAAIRDRPGLVGACLHDLVRIGEPQRTNGLGWQAPTSPSTARSLRCAPGTPHRWTMADRVVCSPASWKRTGTRCGPTMSPGAPRRCCRRTPRLAAAERRRSTRLRAGFPNALLPNEVTLRAGEVAEDVNLRPGELQVARLAAAGLADREIAAALHLSVRTIGNYLQRAYRRLGIRGRDELHESMLGGLPVSEMPFR